MKKLLVTSASLLLASNLFAATEPQKECPPVDMVKSHAAFTQAARDYGTYWGMVSDNFDYNGTDWNVAFEVNLPDANNAEEALLKGQDFFNQGVFLSNPERNVYQGMTVCLYAAVEQQYAVAAINPPIGLPHTFNFMKR